MSAEEMNEMCMKTPRRLYECKSLLPLSASSFFRLLFVSLLSPFDPPPIHLHPDPSLFLSRYLGEEVHSFFFPEPVEEEEELALEDILVGDEEEDGEREEALMGGDEEMGGGGGDMGGDGFVTGGLGGGGYDEDGDDADTEEEDDDGDVEDGNEVEYG